MIEGHPTKLGRACSTHKPAAVGEPAASLTSAANGNDLRCGRRADVAGGVQRVGADRGCIRGLALWTNVWSYVGSGTRRRHRFHVVDRGDAARLLPGALTGARAGNADAARTVTFLYTVCNPSNQNLCE